MMKKLLLLSVALVCTTTFAQTAPPPRAMLDMNNPDDVVKSDRKLQSSLKDGEEVVYYWETGRAMSTPASPARKIATCFIIGG